MGYGTRLNSATVYIPLETHPTESSRLLNGDWLRPDDVVVMMAGDLGVPPDTDQLLVEWLFFR
jgi:hypothetical protein